MDLRALARVAGRQDGLFTPADAAICGFSRYQVRRRLASGEWQQVLGRVFAVAGTEITVSRRDRAAQLAVPGSVLGGPSAARAWGMPVPDGPSALLVRPHRPVRLPGVVVLYGSAGVREVAVLEGRRVTRRERTVFDCLRLLAERPAADLLDHALRQGWTTLPAMVELLRGHVGRRGAPRARRVLARHVGGEWSEAERRLTGLLRAARITGWRCNVPVADDAGPVGVGDVVFARERVVLEVDGLAHHVSARRFQHDRSRQNRLVAAGWRVLRFTWSDIVDRPERVVATVRTVLAGRVGRPHTG